MNQVVAAELGPALIGILIYGRIGFLLWITSLHFVKVLLLAYGAGSSRTPFLTSLIRHTPKSLRSDIGTNHIILPIVSRWWPTNKMSGQWSNISSDFRICPIHHMNWDRSVSSGNKFSSGSQSFPDRNLSLASWIRSTFICLPTRFGLSWWTHGLLDWVYC